jgi:FixJ family two-component response regulator
VVKQSQRCVVAVVDDDAKVRESVNYLLASAGFDAGLFSSAEEFMSTCDRKLSCCLITDVRMPGAGGWELQRLSVQKFPKPPVVFITAYQDDEVRERVMELTAVALLHKPFDGDELLEIVDAAINKYQSSGTHSYRLKG